jgi:hypothetical protein
MKWVLVAIGVLLGGLFVVACDCALGSSDIGCGSGMGFVVHVPADRVGLDGAVVTVCHNDECASGTTPTWIAAPDLYSPTVGWWYGSIAFAGALQAGAAVEVTPLGRATVTIGINLRQDQARDGDLWSVRVFDAQRAPIIDFSRRLNYTRIQLGSGEGCGMTCYGGKIDVWPSSANGLTCESHSCLSGVDLTGEVTLPDQAPTGARFEACRNAVCAEVTQPLQRFEGALRVNLSEDRQINSNQLTFHISMPEDPAMLASGDIYRVTMTASDGTVLANINETVTYEETFPNGPTCDAFPCRRATLTP